MGNETINNIPNNFYDCLTQIQCRDYMKAYNDLNPLQYFELALTKISDLLSQEEKDDLQDYVDDIQQRAEKIKHEKNLETKTMNTL